MTKLSDTTCMVVLWMGQTLILQTTMQGREALRTIKGWRSRSPIHRAMMRPTTTIRDHTFVTARLIRIASALGYAMENAANFNGVQPKNIFVMPGLAVGDPNTQKVFVTEVTETKVKRKRTTLRLLTHSEAVAALEMGE